MLPPSKVIDHDAVIHRTTSNAIHARRAKAAIARNKHLLEKALKAEKHMRRFGVDPAFKKINQPKQASTPSPTAIKKDAHMQQKQRAAETT